MAAFFFPAVVFLVAATAVAVVGSFVSIQDGRWLWLHLAFVGGISQLVLGAAQFFAGAYLATGPPPRTLVRAQLGLWNSGTLILVLGRLSVSAEVASLGGALLLAGLVCFSLALRELRRGSLQSYPWATRWYQACVGFLFVGAVAGDAVAGGARWSWGDIVSAHMTLNVLGWFGTAIVGTLHTFYPSLCGNRLWRPGLQGPTFISWTAGTAVLAVGFAFGASAAQAAGIVLLTVAAVMLLANVLGTALSAGAGRSFSARLVGYAQPCLAVGLAVALVGLVRTDFQLAGEYRTAAAALLLGGWVGLTVAGSLIHLLTVLGRIRDLSRPPQSAPLLLPGAMPPAAIALIGLTAIGALLGAGWLAQIGGLGIGAVYLLLLATVVRLAYRAARIARLRV